MFTVAARARFRRRWPGKAPAHIGWVVGDSDYSPRRTRYDAGTIRQEQTLDMSTHRQRYLEFADYHIAMVTYL